MARIISVLLLAGAVAAVGPPTALAATHVWISFDGDFGAATSWNTGKTPSQWLPTDSVLFNGAIQTSVTTGLDQTGVRVASIFFHDQYDGDVGNSGSPLTISADTFTFRGYGALNYKAIMPPDKLDFAVIDSPSIGHLIWGSHRFLVIKSGYVTVQQSATIGTLFMDPSPGNPAFAPNVVIQQGQSIPLIVGGGANCTNHRNIGSGHILRVERGSFVQEGVIENGAHLFMEGGHFIYDPNDEPPTPGPTAEFQTGTTDFRDTFYDLHFSIGIKGYAADILANQAPSLMGIVDLSVDTPSFSFLNRNDSDSDGIFNVFDACPSTPNYAPDPCGGVTLRDFASFQNAMTGP